MVAGTLVLLVVVVYHALSLVYIYTFSLNILGIKLKYFYISGITTSPSKLAVRTNTSKLVTTTNNNVHEKIVRSASGDSKDSSGPYKLLPPSISYSANNSNRTLVNDKLYPRIPNPGPPLYHPSGPQPQRSQTLSMIPSHSSRTKMGASQVTIVK